MKVTLHFFIPFYVAAVANGTRTTRPFANEGVGQGFNGAEKRSLTRTDGGNDIGEYYYGFERHDPKTLKGKGKGKGNQWPSYIPSLSPPTKSPSPVSPPDSSLAPSPKKKKQDVSKKMKIYESKNLEASKQKDRVQAVAKGREKEKGKEVVVAAETTTKLYLVLALSSTPFQRQSPKYLFAHQYHVATIPGPIAAYVTHALPSTSTSSGFELFWDDIYSEIARVSSAEDVCFIMTGLNSVGSDRTLDQVLIDTTTFVSEIPTVVAIIATDPTENADLVEEIRRISDSNTLPSIGIFNAGYNNIIIESIISGQGRLPYIGYLKDADYGTTAGTISKELLNNVSAVPVCFNARLGVLDFLGERCAAYYNEISSELIEPEFGVACSPNSTVTDVLAQLNRDGGSVNAVWAPIECCSVVADAVTAIRNMGRTIVVGCQDTDTTGGRIDFVTTQPIPLQAYSAASWANFPVIQSILGNDGRGEQYFPSLQSLVNTAIFNIAIP